MRKKWFVFAVKYHIRIFFLLMILAIVGFKANNYNQPLDWYRDLFGIGIIMAMGFLLVFLFWYFFIRKNSATLKSIDYRFQLRYRCTACTFVCLEDNKPSDNLCPNDKIPLVTYDPVEDKDTYWI